MRERPILFSAPMVRAILAGEKTQTRRAVRHLPGFGPVSQFGESDTAGYDWAFRDRCMRWNEVDDTRLRQQFCPYGVIGDRLWVRETWGVLFNDQVADVENEPTWYRASDEEPGQVMPTRWRPSIHMPRARSRITLELTDVRVERLQSITPADIKAEGVRIPVCGETRKVMVDISTPNGPGAFLTREQFGDPEQLLRAHWAALWCQVNGRASWDANPWVWALTFKRVEAKA